MHAPDTQAPARRPEKPAPLPMAMWAAAALIVIAAIVTAFVLGSRKTHAASDEAARRVTDAAGGPEVQAVAAVASAPSHHLVLLAEARPFESVTLYAKVSGYLKWIGVDKGDHGQGRSGRRDHRIA